MVVHLPPPVALHRDVRHRTLLLLLLIDRSIEMVDVIDVVAKLASCKHNNDTTQLYIYTCPCCWKIAEEKVLCTTGDHICAGYGGDHICLLHAAVSYV